MPCTLYLDGSLICAIADPPSRRASLRLTQQLARRWWRLHSHAFHCCTSEYTFPALTTGNPHLFSARLTLAQSLMQLPTSKECEHIEELLLSGGGLLAHDWRNGFELECAALHGIGMFATCDGAFGAALRIPKLRFLFDSKELVMPDIVTVLQLAEEKYDP